MPVKRKTRKPYSSAVRTAAADETRARIIEAARALLAGDKESPAFSLDAVAREAGVTRLTVYNQFEAKRGLLEAVFDDTARRGGLFELSSVLAEPDVAKALHRFVAVFCGFWSAHGKVFPKFSAVARLDDEIAESLRQRSERRRHALTVLAGRLGQGRDHADFVDAVFALTSFEMFEMLSVRGRTPAATQALIQQMAGDLLSRYLGKRPPGKA
jgi:AcrR family transcriptional regulator